MAAENEIHLTCRKCSTVYRLDPVQLGDGRMVRCTACRSEWYQAAPVDGVIPEPMDAPPAPPPQPEVSLEMEPAPVQPPEWDAASEDLTIKPEDKGEFVLQDDMRVVPETVMPEPVLPKQGEVSLEAITHKPMGMGAGAFGLFVFLFLFCATFSTALVWRQQIVSYYPPMLTLYKTIGVRVDAPGQGLTFSVMTAENRIDKETRTLEINVRLQNISDHDAPYPSYRVAVRDAAGSVLKKWPFAADKKTIASGETVPIAMKIHDMPEDAKTAEVTVTAD